MESRTKQKPRVMIFERKEESIVTQPPLYFSGIVVDAQQMFSDYP